MLENDQSKKNDLTSTLTLVWPLLASMFFIMVGNGLQGTLLTLRGSSAGFSGTAIGFIMALYYLGYVAGWFFIPQMVRSVGHIRVFAGFASLASTTILLHGMFVHPIIWAAIRIFSGMSFVSLFIVAESWLNNISPNHLRGTILSAYFFVINGGLFFGQFLLNLAPIETMGLFVLISILVSLSLVPITLANKPSPGYEEPEPLNFKTLFQKSPLSVGSVVLSGLVGSAIIATGPLYVQMQGFGTSHIAIFIAAYVLGSSLLPLLAGNLSDKWGRRKIIMIMAFGGLNACTGAYYFSQHIFWLIIAIGGFTASIHSVAIAMMNDRIKPSQMTSATASLILINGASACISPIIMGVVLDSNAPEFYFILLASSFALLTGFSLYRRKFGPKIKISEQGDYQLIPMRGTASASQLIVPENPKQQSALQNFSDKARTFFNRRTSAEKGVTVDIKTRSHK